MLHFLEPFSFFVSTHPILAYGVLFLAIVWEGELTLLFSGILNHLHVLSLPPTIGIAVLAVLVKMIGGYYLGRFIGRAFPKSNVLKYLRRRVLYFLPQFKKSPFWSIFLSKFIYGVNNVTLLFAGYMRADFKKYCLAEAVSSAIWLGGLFGLGYFASRTALSISHNVRNFTLMVLLFIVAFMLVQKIINLVIEVIEEWQVEEAVE